MAVTQSNCRNKCIEQFDHRLEASRSTIFLAKTMDTLTDDVIAGSRSPPLFYASDSSGFRAILRAILRTHCEGLTDP